MHIICGLGAVQRLPDMVLMVERAWNEPDEPKNLTKMLRSALAIFNPFLAVDDSSFLKYCRE
jgi:hypothetical protein